MMKRMMIRVRMMALLGVVAIGLNSCLPLAAGAAAGYIAHDQGYRVQSPLKKAGD